MARFYCCDHCQKKVENMLHTVEIPYQDYNDWEMELCQVCFDLFRDLCKKFYEEAK